MRSIALLGGVLVAGVHCGSAHRTPAQSAADMENAEPPPPAVASSLLPAAPPAPSMPIVQSGPRPSLASYMKKYAYPVATLPGFEMRADGGSRLFVEVTRNVNVEEKRTERVLTYVLKGTRVVYRNNENSLVTVHFNTPVTRARLLPSGNDLLFSVDLRADASPAWKMVGENDGSATLQIDFPPGSFIPAAEAAEVSTGGPRPATVPPPPPGAPSPAKAWKKVGGRGRAPAPTAAPSPAPPGPSDDAQPTSN